MGLNPFIGSPIGSPAPGYSVWYNATSETAADGATISSLVDRSGNGFNGSLSGSDTACKFYKTTSANLINGRPAYKFVAASTNGFSAGSVAAFNANGSHSVFAVVQEASNPNPAVIIGALIASTITYPLYMATGVTTSETRNTVPTSFAATAGTDTIGTACLVSSITSTSGITARFNRVAGSTTTVTGTLLSGNPTLYIANAQGNSDWFDGLIGEILVYPSALSGTDINTTESYLHAKWATP